MLKRNSISNTEKRLRQAHMHRDRRQKLLKMQIDNTAYIPFNPSERMQNRIARQYTKQSINRRLVAMLIADAE